MKALQRKNSLQFLEINISGYTIDDLSGFENLEKLVLNGTVNVEELCRGLCNKNNLRDLRVLNSEMKDGRLADIAQYCKQVTNFEFKMKVDCDASEYVPLAKMQRLKMLTILGEHETGTLKLFFIALARKEFKLSELCIEDADLNYEETSALSQITCLNYLRCGFKDPRSIEPISKMVDLKKLKILSNHNFKSISQQMCSILEESQCEIKISLNDSKMKYDLKGRLLIELHNNDASDYRTLLTLPKLKCVEINGNHKRGTLVKFLKMLDLVQVESLIICQDNLFSELIGDGECFPLIYPSLGVQEIAALSNCRSLKKLFCEFSDTESLHLLHNLHALEDLTIIRKRPNGSLKTFFAALASQEVPSLKYFRLLHGAIDSLEAAELARIKSLKSVQCDLLDTQDIDKFVDLAKGHLETLEITSNQTLHEKYSGFLKVVQPSPLKTLLPNNKINIFPKSIGFYC
ncbi:uncharacterized protein LOC108033521 isoform X2 [Drosophila biarmipes]|nr:uncharacterized protein LOC108033521 isoform X2 [Drosophila biarmipes]XP_050741176.1 uncharacterized protein LOC108033521 isoform X2 [Drosophila biarmipes]